MKKYGVSAGHLFKKQFCLYYIDLYQILQSSITIRHFVNVKN